MELPDDAVLPKPEPGRSSSSSSTRNNVSTPVNLQGSGHEWQVTLFVVQGFTSNGGTAILGPVLADGGSMAGNTGLNVPPSPPIGAPTTVTQLVDLRCLGRDLRERKQLK